MRGSGRRGWIALGYRALGCPPSHDRRQGEAPGGGAGARRAELVAAGGGGGLADAGLRNARVHGAQNLDAIARSLNDNGQLKALS